MSVTCDGCGRPVVRFKGVVFSVQPSAFVVASMVVVIVVPLAVSVVMLRTASRAKAITRFCQSAYLLPSRCNIPMDSASVFGSGLVWSTTLETVVSLVTQKSC